jgi:hypothetical protein
MVGTVWGHRVRSRTALYTSTCGNSVRRSAIEEWLERVRLYRDEKVRVRLLHINWYLPYHVRSVHYTNHVILAADLNHIFPWDARSWHTDNPINDGNHFCPGLAFKPLYVISEPRDEILTRRRERKSDDIQFRVRCCVGISPQCTRNRGK